MGMLVDECLSRRYIRAHEQAGNIGCNSGIFNLDLLQDTGFRVQSCLPELCSIHFTKTFVALQGEIALVGLAVLLKGLIIIEVFLPALGRHGLVQRRHGDIDMAFINQLRHKPVEKSAIMIILL